MKYRVTKGILAHNRRDYYVGDELELDGIIAIPLIAAGVIELAQEPEVKIKHAAIGITEEMARLMTIKGISEKRSLKLQRAGIDSAQKLYDANPADIIEILQGEEFGPKDPFVNPAQIGRWQADAKRLLDEELTS